MAKDTKLEDIVSLSKRRGFIYQGSDVYGGLSGTWDYGPLGVALKRNIMNLWWKMFVDERDDMYGVDAAILMNQKVWQASGHTETFTDPLIDCRNCNSRYRTDHLLKENIPKAWEYIEDVRKAMLEDEIPVIYMPTADWEDPQTVVEPFLEDSNKTELKEMLDAKVPCPNCGKKNWGESKQFNMMFATPVGPTWGSFEPKYDNTLEGEVISRDKYGAEKEKFSIKPGRSDINALMAYDKNSKSYLRPETAQGIFTNYKNVVDSFYPDLPFGMAQQGKAFRNEISPRDFVFRSREFEQMEIEYFVQPDKWEESFNMWVELCKKWFDALGLPAETIHELEVTGDDLAHYSKRTIDFEFDFPIGREELMGLAYRTDFDLGNIQRASGKSMEYTIKGTNEKFVPHVIEPSFGVERALMAVLTTAYTEDEVNGEKRVYLKLPEHLAPVKYAVSPLLKNKPELVEKAREVYMALKKKHGNIMWDDNGNIGKRYRRQDEIGTPYCVVIDFQTLEDDTVTVRDRDTTQQKRVSITDIVE